jgi:ATP-dependent protease ClpP protease subunit
VKTVLLLYDEITAGTAKRFVAELSRVAATADVTIMLNCPGGAVSSGEEIFNAIRRHKGQVTVSITGIAASAASYIAMAATTIEMVVGSFLMVHNPFVQMIDGDAKRLGNVAAALAVVEARYATVYARRSGQSEARVREWMDAETWFDARQAVELGFADSVNGSLPVAERVSAMALKFKHAPAEVRAMAKSSSRTPEQRARLRRRLQLIAMQARFGRDPKRDEADRERGARMRRRYEMQATVEAIKADDRAVDAAERATIRERQRRDYYYNWQGVPHGQRR